MDCSIIVPCRNEARHIDDFLKSVQKQEFGDYTWEVLIADGASSDGTAERLREFAAAHPEFRIVSNPQKVVSTGLNLAIREARGKYIIRLDVHAVYAPDYCRTCIDTLVRTRATNVGGPARTIARGRLAMAIAAAYHSSFSTGGAKFHDEQFEGWVDTVPFGCWERETLVAAGLFDETLVRNQDDELNLRLVRAGGKIWQTPEIRCWYSTRDSLGKLFHQYFQYGFWKVAVIRKHRLPASWRHLVPVTFVAANALCAAALLLRAPLALPVWLGLLTGYFAVLLFASAITARGSGGTGAAYLPAVFATFHISYGLGFLAGAKWLFVKPPQPSGAESVFSRLSR
ncbi:MAG: glycosyltransferase family 2 protein [Acidobacteriota bacterium]|nr:glycosyltransferase family 2 protein [Acidobacteriota bacterium]